MPNWCDNELRITGPPEQLDRFVQEARGVPPLYGPDRDTDNPPLEEALCFHNLYPVPDGLLERTYGASAEDEKDLPPVDGCRSGHDWEVRHWGTKWGPSDSCCEVLATGDGGGEVEYGFSTAWTPPLGFLQHVSTRFPELRFDLRYSEIGCAFQGRFIVQGGDVKLDVCRDLVEEDTP